MSDKKQIPALPALDEAPADDDRFALRDTSSGSDKSLRVDRMLERSAEQVSEHSDETGGIHGIPEGERALHTDDLGPAPDNVPTNQQLQEGVDRVDDTHIGKPRFYEKLEIAPSDQDLYLLLAKSGSVDSYIYGAVFGAQNRIARSHALELNFAKRGSDDSDDGPPLTAYLFGQSLSGGRGYEAGNGAALVTVDFEGENWVAVKIPTSSRPMRFSYFLGSRSGEAGQLTWPLDEDLSNEQPFEPSGGVGFFGRPGDIVESGSNSNGSYIRWENGEQVCWRSSAHDTTTVSQAAHDAPASFVDDTVASAIAVGSTGDLSDVEDFNGIAVSFSTPNHEWRTRRDSDDGSSSSLGIVLFAWGFWK